MRLKDLFTVPTGQKVTEKCLHRVLISSICSILLCMACLAGTTWAWFAVSIENTGNVIQIGTPEVKLMVNGESFNSGKELPAGKNEILIEHANEQDDLQKKSTLYVTLSVNNVVRGYVMLDSNNGYKTSIIIETAEQYPLSWTASWFDPGNPDVKPLIDNPIHITVENPTEETTEATTVPAATEEMTGSTKTTTPATEETTIPTADATTAPTTAPTSIPTETG